MMIWRLRYFTGLAGSIKTRDTFLEVKKFRGFVLRRTLHSLWRAAFIWTSHKLSLYNFCCVWKSKCSYTVQCGNGTLQNSSPPWRVLFYGTDNMSVICLTVLYKNWRHGNPKIVSHLEVVSVPFKRKKIPVRKYAQENGIVLHDWPYCPPKEMFDVGIVASFGHLLPVDVIQSFRFGILNVHPSLLPRWRGATPEIHTILHGDTETGVTIMAIAPYKFDTGKILLQQSCQVTENMTALELTGVLAKLGAALLMKSLRDLCYLLKNSRDQDSTLVTKAPKIKKSKAIIKWEQHSCTYIDRLYRALSHQMKLLTFWDGNLIKLSNMVSPKEMLEMNVNKILELENVTPDVRPGKVIYHKRRKVLCILCQDGWVGFRNVMINGHNSRTALDFYNGFMSKVNSSQHYFQ